MFTERLKSLRKEAGLTQKDVAEHLGIKQPTYAQWENGRTKPKGETLEKFANFFNVSTDYLLGNSDYKTTIDQDIEEAIQRSVAYQGNPISEDDKQAISDFLKNYFNEKEKD